jgi:hypothetical protein
MADSAARDGQAPSIIFSLNVYTSEAFTSWTMYHTLSWRKIERQI